MERIGELSRRFNADPNNDQAYVELLLNRGRVEGSWVFLEVLQDANLWQAAPVVVQDLAIEEVARRLGDTFKHKETRGYECLEKFRIATFEQCKTGVELQLIPGGRYMMGLNPEESQVELDFVQTTFNHNHFWIDWEFPSHEVTIAPLLVGRTPVTQQQWETLLPHSSVFKGADNPVDNVSWNAVQEWMLEAGGELRLPSEAEWEYGCRAGTTTRFFWGDEWKPEYCWFKDNAKSTQSVSTHRKYSNAFGLVDTLGNVWEWCQDDWIDQYKEGPSNQSPRGDGSGDIRVMRGGAWCFGGARVRSSSRDGNGPSREENYLGFRVARSLSLRPGNE